jgi:hypothetical protein
LYRVAPHDAQVARAFLEVVHMMKPPVRLFAPGIAWRVLRGRAGGDAHLLGTPARAAT